MSGLSRGCRTCCQKQQNKIQPANKKASANFSGAKIRGAHFPAGGIFVSGLAGQHIPFRRQPANTSRHHSFHTGPQSSTSQLPSSRLGRPTPYIPSYHFFNIHRTSSSHQVSLPTILPKSTNNHLPQTSSHRISVIFPDITPHYSTHLPFSIFPFSISRPTSSRPSSFRTSNFALKSHPVSFPTPSTSSVLLPLLQPAGQTRNVVSRAGAACKAAGVAGEEPAFLLFSLCFFLSASLFSFFFPISLVSLAPRLRRDAFIFLFAFLHIFVFSFCSYFCFSFCFFLFDFFSLFFLLFFILVFSLSFLFAFSFFLLLLLSLFFVFYFYFCFSS